MRPYCSLTHNIFLLLLFFGIASNAGAGVRVFQGGAITINDNTEASPYPSTVSVSGIAGNTTAVRVTLKGLSHTFPDDLDIFLVAPDGRAAVVFSDAGGSADISNLTLTLDDDAVTVIPGNSELEIGTYRPADHDVVESLPTGVSGPLVGSLSELILGLNSSGNWKLYVRDDASSDTGSIIGWTLELESTEIADSGDLGVERINHTATLLQDGRIFVAGGYENNSGSDSITELVEIFNPGNGTWEMAAALPVPKHDHTATMLTSGKILVVGGADGVLLSDATELVFTYDPRLDEWAEVAPMTTPRQGHTATLLPDGTVLVVGGINGTGEVANAERYNPTTDTWSEASNLAFARYDHTATLLDAGIVVVVGGNGAGASATTELYDPGSDQWFRSNDLANGRKNHTATLLRDGQVLVVGGGAPGGPAAERFNTVSFTWSSVADPFVLDRSNHSATLLPDGTVLVAGGSAGILAGTTTEQYNPSTDTWVLGGVIDDRTNHTATLLPGGQVLLAAGSTSTGTELATSQVISPPTAGWAETTPMTPRRSHAATLLADGNVLVTGGQDLSDQATFTAEIFQAGTGNWAPVSGMIKSRFAHTSTLLADGKVLVAGGYNNAEEFLTHAERFDPVGGTWQSVGLLSEARREHTATVLPDGRVLVVGGFDGASYLAGAEIFDPATDTWSPTGSLATERAFHTATLLFNGKVLVTGGVNFGARSFINAAELYNPSTGTWSPAGIASASRSNHAAVLLPDGTVLLMGGSGDSAEITEIYDPSTGIFTETTPMFDPPASPVAVLLDNGTVLVAGNGTGLEWFTNSEIYHPATQTWSLAPQTQARSGQTATYLPDGRVLMAGGSGLFELASKAQFFRPDRGFDPSWQPNVASMFFDPGGPLVVQGSGFVDQTPASGGGTRDSATNYPLLQLRQIDSGKTIYIPSSRFAGFNDVIFFSEWIPPYTGKVLATMVVNGVPSNTTMLDSSISEGQDFDEDGFKDTTEFQGIRLGVPLDPFTEQPTLSAELEDFVVNAGYFTSDAYNDNRSAGQQDVIDNPNDFSLYTLDQLQALNVGTPLLQVDPTTGKLTLTIGVQKATDVTGPFQPFPMDGPGVSTSVNEDGDLELEFNPTDNAAFFLLESR